MQTVTPGASHLQVTPIAYGTWQFGGDWSQWTNRPRWPAWSARAAARHAGVSNYGTDQITEFAAVLPAETVQPPYHLFRRDIEADLLPYARAHHIGVLAYGPLAHGPLSGTITEATTFGGDDWRSHSPAFTGRVSGAISKSSRRRAAPPRTAAPLSPSSRWPGRLPTRPYRSPSSARALRPISRKASTPSIAP